VYDAHVAEPAPIPELPARIAPVTGAFGGWRIVGIAALCHALGFGLMGVLSFVNTPLTREFGATQAQMGLGLSLSIVSPAICGPLLGWLLDRGPLRAIMLLGLAIMLGGATWIARGEALVELAAGFAVVTVGMSMYGMFPANVMIVNWFVIRRGKALAVATAGASLAGLLVPQIASRLIERLGWRDALLAIAFGAAAIAAPLIAAFAIKRPEDAGQHPDGLPPLEPSASQPSRLVEIPIGSLLRDPSFWLVGIGLGLAFCTAIPDFYLVRYMETELGMPAVQAAIPASLGALGGITGRIIAGWAADRFDKRVLLLAALGMVALGWAIAVGVPSFGGLIAAEIVKGLGVGSIFPLAPVVQGACFGRAMIGRVSGLHALLGLPFLIAIAPLVGYAHAQTGSFAQPFLGLVGVCALAALLFAFARIPRVEPGR
jgi:MFS family permease